MVYILQTTVVTSHSYQAIKVRTLTPKSYISFEEASDALQTECALIDSHYKINNLYDSRKIKLKIRLVDDESRKVILISYTNDNFETMKIYTMQILKTSS